jgi:hypothetical protein
MWRLVSAPPVIRFPVLIFYYWEIEIKKRAYPSKTGICELSAKTGRFGFRLHGVRTHSNPEGVVYRKMKPENAIV